MNNTIKYNGKLNAIGSKIKEYRIKNNMTQQQLTDKMQLFGIDINKNSLQKIESNNRIIKEYELAVLSIIFDVPTDELLKDCIKNFLKFKIKFF